VSAGIEKLQQEHEALASNLAQAKEKQQQQQQRSNQQQLLLLLLSPGQLGFLGLCQYDFFGLSQLGSNSQSDKQAATSSSGARGSGTPRAAGAGNSSSNDGGAGSSRSNDGGTGSSSSSSSSGSLDAYIDGLSRLLASSKLKIETMQQQLAAIKTEFRYLTGYYCADDCVTGSAWTLHQPGTFLTCFQTLLDEVAMTQRDKTLLKQVTAMLAECPHAQKQAAADAQAAQQATDAAAAAAEAPAVLQAADAAAAKAQAVLQATETAAGETQAVLQATNAAAGEAQTVLQATDAAAAAAGAQTVLQATDAAAAAGAQTVLQATDAAAAAGAQTVLQATDAAAGEAQAVLQATDAAAGEAQAVMQADDAAAAEARDVQQATDAAAKEEQQALMQQLKKYAARERVRGNAAAVAGKPSAWIFGSKDPLSGIEVHNSMMAEAGLARICIPQQSSIPPAAPTAGTARHGRAVQPTRSLDSAMFAAVYGRAGQPGSNAAGSKLALRRGQGCDQAWQNRAARLPGQLGKSCGTLPSSSAASSRARFSSGRFAMG
jgi:hypothetical protein